MPKRIYALPPDGRRQLEITWQQHYRLLVVRLDGKLIGMISNLEALRGQQKVFLLPDRSRLRVEKSYFGKGFSVYLNEECLISRSTPATNHHSSAANVVVSICGEILGAIGRMIVQTIVRIVLDFVVAFFAHLF